MNQGSDEMKPASKEAVLIDHLFPLELSNSAGSKRNYFGKEMWEGFCYVFQARQKSLSCF